MITSSLAQIKAVKLISEYIIQCECETAEEIGNALMKLMGVTGGALINTEGQFIAVARTQAVVNHMAAAKLSTPPLPIDEQQYKNITSIH